MALTKVSRGLLSTSIVDNGNATAITIDSSQNVGIGVSPSSEFHVKGDANTIARIEPNNNSGKATLLVSSTASGDGGIQYDANNNQTHLFSYSDMTFNVGTGNLSGGYPANERMRISGGNLLVGYTAADGIGGAPSDNNFSELGKGYINLNRDDLAHATQIQFGKNGAVVGRIHTDDRLSIGTSSTGLYFYNSGNSILPYDNSAATPVTRDNAIDLGSSGARFKDLYLGGGVYLGGTGAANKLDYYEFGTWTPVIKGTGGTTTASFSSIDASYTRVGRLVYASVYIHTIVWSDISDGNYVVIEGLPFAANADNYAAPVFGLNNTNVVGGYVENNGQVYLNNGNAIEFRQANNDITGTQFMFSATYNCNF
jgi:hypothetical protein